MAHCGQPGLFLGPQRATYLIRLLVRDWLPLKMTLRMQWPMKQENQDRKRGTRTKPNHTYTHQGSHRKEGQKSLTEGLTFLKDKTFKCFYMEKQVQNPGWTVWAWNLPPRSCPRVMVGGWADYKEDLTHQGSIVLVCYECLPFGRCLLELLKQQLGCFTWMREIIANIWQLMVKIIIMQCIFMLLTPPWFK
jgi:hypothetical protein